MLQYSSPTIINGGSHTDTRGTISYVNDFNLKGVTQFYTIQHPNTKIVRAWQGHPVNAKYFFPVKGTWVIGWLKINYSIPDTQWEAEHIVLKAEGNKMLYIPPGYANGLKALENDSIITVFTVPGEKKEEILRWDWKRWLDWDNIRVD